MTKAESMAWRPTRNLLRTAVRKQRLLKNKTLKCDWAASLGMVAATQHFQMRKRIRVGS
jgi:hypothetical protein